MNGCQSRRRLCWRIDRGGYPPGGEIRGKTATEIRGKTALVETMAATPTGQALTEIGDDGTHLEGMGGVERWGMAGWSGRGSKEQVVPHFVPQTAIFPNPTKTATLRVTVTV